LTKLPIVFAMLFIYGLLVVSTNTTMTHPNVKFKRKEVDVIDTLLDL